MDMEACVALKLVHCLERHPDRIAVSELFQAVRGKIIPRELPKRQRLHLVITSFARGAGSNWLK